MNRGARPDGTGHRRAIYGLLCEPHAVREGREQDSLQGISPPAALSAQYARLGLPGRTRVIEISPPAKQGPGPPSAMI